MPNIINKYILPIDNIHNLSKEEEKKLILQAKKRGPDALAAKTQLFQSHLRLILKIINQYKVQNIQTQDLFQEGLMGFEDALKRFDVNKNCRFSTIAQWWVKAKILKYIRKNLRIFDVPHTASNQIILINKRLQKLSQELEHLPSDKELAENLNIKEEKLKFLRKFLIPSVSINKNVYIDNSLLKKTSIQDFLTDDRNNALETLLRNDGIKAVKKYLTKLTPIQRTIIEYRYGLNGQKLTLKQVGKKLNLTAERVRQIQNKTKIQLKHLMDK
jgi:RNA polymerase sigma factor (sigma-70 family)